MTEKKKATKSVFVVNIEERKSDSNGLFFTRYNDLVAELKTHPMLEVNFITSVSSLQSKCIECNPMTTVLLFTNEFVTENETVANIVQSFVKGGALAIFGCLFASFAKPDNEMKLFTSLGLPWKRGSFDSAKFVISPIGKFLLDDFEEQFFAKAHMLSNVLPEQKLYAPEVNAMAQQNLLLSETVDTSLTIAAFSKIGKGAVSYVGNDNIENGLIRLIVSLCAVNF